MSKDKIIQIVLQDARMYGLGESGTTYIMTTEEQNITNTSGMSSWSQPRIKRR